MWSRLRRMKPSKILQMMRNKRKNQLPVDFLAPRVPTLLENLAPNSEVRLMRASLRLILKRSLKPPRKFIKNNRKTQFNIRSKKWTRIPAVMTLPQK